jgi:hypothetical protein
VKISFVTLVNKEDVYSENVLGSIPDYNGVEFIPIFFPMTATSGLNTGIQKSKNDIIVMCHQDVRFSEGWIEKLEKQITLLKDDNWGVLGTFGVSFNGKDGVGNILSGNKTPEEIRGAVTSEFSPALPCKAMSLDEHCLIIRKNSGLRFDESLRHFHYYGADLCLTSYRKKMKCYAVDAYLHHLSDNINRGEDFVKAEEWLIRKWKGCSSFPVFRTSCRLRIDL